MRNRQPLPNPSSDGEISDSELLSEVLQRKEWAWRQLIARFRNLVIRCITKVARRHHNRLNDDDVEEIFSEFCCNLLHHNMRKLRAYDPARGTKFSSWLGLLAINSTYDFLRQRARQPLLDKIDGVVDRTDDADDAFETLWQKERRLYLHQLLRSCSARDRLFVDLYFDQGLEPGEVAQKMGMSLKTVYTRKLKLRKRLVALAGR